MSKIGGAIIEVFEEAMEKSLARGLIEAQLLSQGTASQTVLNEEDNPYAKRHGIPLRPPEIINEQTGDFLRAWRTDPVETDWEGVHGAIINDDKAADFLNQTWGGSRSTMFRRPIKDEVESATEALLVLNVIQGLNKLESVDIYL